MGNKKELRKMTQTEKAITQARGEAILMLGIVIFVICLLFAVIEVGLGNALKVVAFVAIILAYVTGALILSYKYQKTKLYLLMAIIGGILTLLSIIFYIMQ